MSGWKAGNQIESNHINFVKKTTDVTKNDPWWF